MKGVLALEQDIKGARTRLLRLCDAGRLGDDPQALKLVKQIASMLRIARMLSVSLCEYEVGRQIDDKDTRSSWACSQAKYSKDRL